jgi:hypothetical protein
MHLEIVEIVIERRYVDRLHPLLNATLEAVSLVAGEVETSRTLEIGEQALEVRLTLGHGKPELAREAGRENPDAERVRARRMLRQVLEISRVARFV